MPEGLTLNINWQSWKRPYLFDLIQAAGDVPEQDMRRTFNLGVGLIMIVSPKQAVAIQVSLRRKRERPFVIGEVGQAAHR